MQRSETDQTMAQDLVRYRALFDGIDEGFCIIQFIDGPEGPLSDYVHVEANPAYARHAVVTKPFALDDFSARVSRLLSAET